MEIESNPKPEPKRKIISIHRGYNETLALCDDGTTYVLEYAYFDTSKKYFWVKVENILHGHAIENEVKNEIRSLSLSK